MNLYKKIMGLLNFKSGSGNESKDVIIKILREQEVGEKTIQKVVDIFSENNNKVIYSSPEKASEAIFSHLINISEKAMQYSHQWSKNLIVVGSPGSGKTTFIKKFIVEHSEASEKIFYNGASSSFSLLKKHCQNYNFVSSAEEATMLIYEPETKEEYLNTLVENPNLESVAVIATNTNEEIVESTLANYSPLYVVVSKDDMSPKVGTIVDIAINKDSWSGTIVGFTNSEIGSNGGIMQCDYGQNKLFIQLSGEGIEVSKENISKFVESQKNVEDLSAYRTHLVNYSAIDYSKLQDAIKMVEKLGLKNAKLQEMIKAMTPETLSVTQKKVKVQIAMIDGMTKIEKKDPESISGERILAIELGAGGEKGDFVHMIEAYKMFKKQMSNIDSSKGLGGMFDGLKL